MRLTGNAKVRRDHVMSCQARPLFGAATGTSVCRGHGLASVPYWRVQSTDSVETFRGRGRILRDGQVVLEGARYVVHVSTPRDGGPLRLEGVLMSDAPFELLRQPIELELEDRRRWVCRLQSTSGDLVDRGGLLPAAG